MSIPFGYFMQKTYRIILHPLYHSTLSWPNCEPTDVGSSAAPEIQKVLRGRQWLFVHNRSELSSEQKDQLDKILKLCSELRTCICSRRNSARSSRKPNAEKRLPDFSMHGILKAERTGDKYPATFPAALRSRKTKPSTTISSNESARGSSRASITL